MNIWKQAPFIKLIIPLILGILLYRTGLSESVIYISIIVLVSSIIIISAHLIFPKKLYSFRNQYFYTFLYFAAFLSFSVLYSFNSDPRNNERFVGNIKTEQNQKYLAEVSNVAEKGNNYRKTTCNLLAVKDKQNKWVKINGKILLYLENKDSTIIPEYGNTIAISTTLQSPQEALFNSDFDYKKFLANKNIFYQSFVGSSNWEIIDKSEGNPIIRYSLHLRNQMIKILKQQLGDEDEYAVLAAMLTGYRADLSADMQKAYSGSGAMHIMSVSGLHVGTIYILTVFIIGLLPILRKKKKAKGVIVLLFIWMFAFITGLSASVLRASIMLTFVVVGEMMNRKISIFNSLTAAAFFLLLYNPNMLFEIGFQLSFVAVIGIATLFKPINRLFYFKNRILSYIWQLISVSLAAQISTLPFTLFYFGQFPVYFMLSNIFIVPLSGIAIYLGVATIALSFIPYVSDLVAWLMVKCAWLMNQIAFSIEGLPGAVIENINIPQIPTIILGLIIILLMIFLIKKKIRLVYPIFICTIAFILAQNNHSKTIYNEDYIVIAKDKKQYVNAAKIYDSFYLIENPDTTIQTSDYFRSRIKKYTKKNNLNLIILNNKNSCDYVYVNKEFRQFKDFRLLLWTEKKNPEKIEEFPKMDLAVRTNNSKYYNKEFLEKTPSKVVITPKESNISENISLNKYREMKIKI